MDDRSVWFVEDDHTMRKVRCVDICRCVVTDLISIIISDRAQQELSMVYIGKDGTIRKPELAGDRPAGLNRMI